MSNRSVVVRLEAEVARFVTGMGRAQKATDEATKIQEKLGRAVDEAAAKAEKAADRVAKGNQKQADSSEQASKSSDKSSESSRKDADSKDRQAQAAEKAGTALAGFGAVSVAGLGASAKAAMDWESAWAGVTKTVEGTPQQMAALEGELRDLATTLPLTHTEIAAVAEAAGQLGVKRQDVAAFTKTMIDLGETTNLSADEAATAIAQLMNVMGTSGKDVDNLGSALVALGNDGASTEKEILMMAQRISGAGKLVGATESDVLALSNTLASLGIEAQLGGGVVSRVLQRMYADVKEGGEGLQAMAKVAGVTGQQFAEAFETDPVRAMDMLVKGMNKVKEGGGNVVATMDDLGIKGTEETGVMLRLAGAGDLLSKSLDLGAESWEKNTALAVEASKRYETTEAQVRIAWNNIKDAAIDAGAVLLPVVQSIAETVSGLSQAFGDLPDPVQGAITTLGGVVGVAALIGGAALNLVPKVRDTISAFHDLNTKADGTPSRMGRVAAAVGKAAAAYTALATGAALAAAATDSERAKTSVEGFTNALSGTSTAGERAKEALNGMFEGVVKPGSDMFTAVNDLDSALKRVFNPEVADNANDFLSTVFGQNATSGVNVTKAAIGDMDKALASFAQSGNFEDAAAGFQLAAEAAKRQDVSLDKLVELFPEYEAAVLAAKTANGETQVSQESLTEAMLKAEPAAESAASAQKALDDSLEQTGVGLDAVIDDMAKFLEQLFATGMITMSARDANAAYNEALRNVDAVIKEINDSGGKMGAMLNQNKTDFDTTTEAGSRANAAFQDIARKGMAEVEALSKEGVGQDELQGKLSGTYDSLVANAEKFGITGQAAKELAREVLGVPDNVDVKTWMDHTASAAASALKTQLDGIDGRVVRTYTVHQIKEVRDSGDVHTANAMETANRYSSGAAYHASGGEIVGPGTGTSDQVPIWASNGEHMLTAEEVRLMGGHSSVYRFRQEIHAGNVPRYASGGAIGVAHAPAQFMPAGWNTPRAGDVTVSPAKVNVFIGNEQIDARIEHVAGAVVTKADAQSAYMRRGR